MKNKAQNVFLFIKKHTSNDISHQQMHNILYVADKLSLSRMGKPILKLSYVAGYHGPVNLSFIYSIENENIDRNKQIDYDEFSISDVVYLEISCKEYCRFLEDKKLDTFTEMSNDIAYKNAFYYEDDRISIEDIARAACPDQYESLIKHLYENGY